jgi:branched-chain amino acid transport system ATP-binding protein
VFEHLTVEQNLKVGAHMKKHGRSIKEGLEMGLYLFSAPEGKAP